MVSKKELMSRIQDFFSFSKQEIIGLVVAVLAVGFIFSFRNWGEETFNLISGLKNFVLVLIIAAISFFFRLSCQKIYGLSQGQKAEYKVWWNGLAASLVIIFISLGRVPLVLAGGMISSLMVKQRLGEFRYGYSNWVMGVTAFWGILGNLIMAIIFAIGLYFFPGSFFFNKGIILNLIMAFCALLPFPQQDGLNLFFGSRILFYIAIGTVVIAGILLLTKTLVGLIIAIVIGLGVAIFYSLIGSEKG
jgi:hypothetical protein